MMAFFEVKRVEEVWALFEGLSTVGTERVALEEALGRVLATPIASDEDFPSFDRATMDGYAVRARDTFGASVSSPVPLRVVGEVKMGEPPPFDLREGEAAVVPTGGMIPRGADGVVMLEHVRRVQGDQIEVLRPISPWENVMRRGEDFSKGEVLLWAGKRLRPEDLALCATLGRKEVEVFERPVVGIISTGDEIVPVEETPAPGQIRDSNHYGLWGLVQQTGGKPIYLGHALDELTSLTSRLQEGLERCSLILISGGSSVGTRDVTLKAFEELEAEVLFHGVAISPGKPTLMALKGQQILWGLPGHPTSCMVVAYVLVRPCLRRIAGEVPYLPPFPYVLEAVASRNIPSAPGREDYVRVTLEEREGKLVAHPLFSKSSAVSSLVKGDGLLRIEADREGVTEGERVKVWPLSP